MKNLRKRRVIKLILKRKTNIQIERTGSVQESMGTYYIYNNLKKQIIKEICIDLSSLVLSTASIKSYNV